MHMIVGIFMPQLIFDDLILPGLIIFISEKENIYRKRRRQTFHQVFSYPPLFMIGRIVVSDRSITRVIIIVRY
jgi:hypothetical protein